MSEETKQIPQQQQPSDGGIDFMHIAQLAWKHRKLYYKALGIAFVVACIIGFSIPKSYKCEVTLAPELATSPSTNSLMTLASSYGLRMGSSSMIGGSDALFPTLYPDMMISTDFLTSLFDVKIRETDSLTTKNYYDYLKNDQRKAWWSAAIGWAVGGVVNAITSLFPEDSLEVGDGSKVNPFMLTEDQTDIAEVVAQKVVCDVDQKTLVITIDVVDQDPLVCATMADSVKERLQDFITEYRTNKARVDLAYYDNLCKESKAQYDKARQIYADFVDANNDLILASERAKQNDLENEMQLRYNAYVNYSSLRQGAEARVQQATPAFTTLQNATVPVKPAGPRKKRIVLVFLFLAFVGTTAYMLHKENELLPMLGLQK